LRTVTYCTENEETPFLSGADAAGEEEFSADEIEKML
jgi:hypothetical protein